MPPANDDDRNAPGTRAAPAAGGRASGPGGDSDANSPRAPEQPARDADADDAPQVAEVPSPSLPKGGGAVRGLGETFQVNPSNGTFTASLPLPGAAARGFAPSLSLHYDSGGGNGPFGEGWSLPAGHISRKTDKVLPRYRDDDVFLGDGEDFVPAEIPDGGVWTQGARDAGTHRVQCYRPRVESAYDRIERWTRKSDGDIHWRTRTKGGVANVFGESPEARMADPVDPTRVFRWLLERSSDGRGGLIHYRYRAEDRANVAPDIWEQHRVPAYTHVDRVLWGTRVPYDDATPAPVDSAAYLFELVFDYGERNAVAAGTPPPYAPVGDWTVRADPYSFHKPGFDLRCYRLCQRVLLFHRVDPAGATPVLVREIDLRYDGDPSLAKLLGATSIGWRDGASIAYPEITFAYSAALVDPTVRQIDLGSAENLPPIDGKRTQWIDLDGEGIPGAIIEDRPGWFYKRNLGGGALAPLERLPTRPSLDRTSGGQLVDVAGDGTKSLVRFGAPAPGLFTRTETFDWAPFAPFVTLPVVDFSDPNLRFIDLDGDGRNDVLLTEDQVLRWYPSLGYDGFGEPALVAKGHDEETGPALVFADAEQSIYLADMTGGGLTDLVRVRNGQVCYWPNLGYGRFGAKITMGNAPRFASAADFAQANVRLADVDGSGTTDIIYCEGDRVRYWLNLAGNSFSAERSVAGLPYDSSARVEAVDLLGNGTSCLVWSSPLPGHARQPLRFIELTGGIKPHLLTAVDNGLGRAITVEYASSTSFYLADRAAGTPWITRVPFPVQVVARITTADQITGNQLAAEYGYHHGFYDGFEREFRGFGMVEQRDTQSLAAVSSQGTFPPGSDQVPPARTRTWFHTGAFIEGASLIARYRSEWFALDADQAQLDEGIMPADLDPEEWREALRALRGRPLRVETYADDQPATPATPVPFQVVETNYRVRTLQRRGADLHGAFVADPLETLTYVYERDAGDPRVEHQIVLAVGPFGAVEQAARVGYPRRGETSGTLATYSEHDVMARADEAVIYRVNVVAETRLYEITGLAPPATSPFVLARAALQAVPALAGTADDLGYDGAPAAGRLQRRLLRRTQAVYYGDDGVTPAPLGSFGALALMRGAERAVLPEAMVATVLPATVDAALLQSAGYVRHDGLWWCPSNVMSYAAGAFYQPTRFADPFGNVTRVDYDGFQLVPAAITNPLGQLTATGYDYLALAASSVTDVNGNTTLATYDALGQLRDVADTGKNGEGDTLAAPTIHYGYTLGDWKTLGTPNHNYTKQRLVYGADGFAERYAYVDGFGRDLMTKVKANPGPALVVEGGVLQQVQADDRWIGTGRTLYDNKGNPVRKYEPFYATGPGYETDPQLAFLGVTAVLRYDPLARLVRTDMPDGAFATVQLGAWQQSESDAADNAAEEAQLWANRAPQSAADQRATAATLLHRRTPSTHLVDAFGRRVATTVDNTQQGVATDVPLGSHVLYRARRVLDVQGRALQIFDDRGLAAGPPYATLAQIFDMRGQAPQQVGADTGASFSLPDCQGRSFYARDARGMELAWTYDVLRRPTRITATDTAHATTFVAEKLVYGDDASVPIDPAANLIGHIYQSYDQAGSVTRSRYDFKGNVLVASRQLISSRQGAPDWTATYLTPFVTSMEYDALARVTRTTLPRRSAAAGTDNVVARAYLVQGPLSRLTVTVQYGVAVDVVSDIDYDATGRRVSARLGNGVVRSYGYDPLTFRLTSLVSTRAGAAPLLQSIAYTYDAAGNVTEIADAAQPAVFTRNQLVDARLAYTYDSIYRLTDASGREMHDPTQPADGDLPFGAWPPDGGDLVSYREQYDYDSCGNLLQVAHRANGGTQGWTRGYGYDPRSNRLIGTSLPGAPDPAVLGAAYVYDDAGDIVAMPHLSSLGWDERGRLGSADQLGGGIAYFRHDDGGARVRKSQTSTASGSEVVVSERIYVGEYELRRRLTPAGAVVSEIETVHGLDGGSRVMVADTETTDAAPTPVVRYQIDNNLGSATVELDDGAALLSYEEYHPFGTTAFHARASVAEVSLKRYRYLGRERDDETGFYFCGARHYCGWLGRWINPDPQGFVAGTNLYRYCRNNPITRFDPGGADDKDANAGQKPAAAPSGDKPMTKQDFDKTLADQGVKDRYGKPEGSGTYVILPNDPAPDAFWPDEPEEKGDGKDAKGGDGGDANDRQASTFNQTQGATDTPNARLHEVVLSKLFGPGTTNKGGYAGQYYFRKTYGESSYGVTGTFSHDFTSHDTNATVSGTGHWWATNDVSPVKVGFYLVPSLGYTNFNDSGKATAGISGTLALSGDINKNLSLDLNFGVGGVTRTQLNDNKTVLGPTGSSTLAATLTPKTDGGVQIPIDVVRTSSSGHDEASGATVTENKVSVGVGVLVPIGTSSAIGVYGAYTHSDQTAGSSPFTSQTTSANAGTANLFLLF